MAIKALDIGKIVDYICKDDDPADPTIFKIGTLSARDKGAIQDTLTSFSVSDDELERIQSKNKGGAADTDDEGDGQFSTQIERSKMHWEAVRRGLKGWENFLDSKGEPVPFKLVLRDVGGGIKKSVVPNELLDVLPYAVLVELAEKIMDDNTAAETDVGNSQEPSMGGSSTKTETAESVPFQRGH